VRELFSRLRRWWADRPGRPARAEPFDVACPCGEHARGVRKARHQVVRCAACGGPVFVLGRSPLAPPGGEAPAAAVPRRYWLGPALAAGLTLAAVAVIFSIAIPALAPSAAPQREPARPDVRDLIAAGRDKLRGEEFHTAVNLFDQARRQSDKYPDALTAPERRELDRLHAQAALIADLLSESLDEILQRAAGTRDAERQEQFNRRYRGRAVIFDDVVARDPAGRFGLGVFEVRAPGEPARVELSDLKLLPALPLAEPRRMLFGARLAGLAREERGGHGLWVIRLEPDSGVLLTDEDAAGACCPRPLDDELKAVLRRQAEWAAALP
jgi:hypothetical protein